MAFPDLYIDDEHLGMTERELDQIKKRIDVIIAQRNACKLVERFKNSPEVKSMHFGVRDEYVLVELEYHVEPGGLYTREDVPEALEGVEGVLRGGEVEDGFDLMALSWYLQGHIPSITHDDWETLLRAVFGSDYARHVEERRARELESGIDAVAPSAQTPLVARARF
jgi:hypothetical protein